MNDTQKVIEILLRMETRQAQGEAQKIGKSLTDVSKTAEDTKKKMSSLATGIKAAFAAAAAALAAHNIKKVASEFLDEASKMEKSIKKIGFAFGSMKAGTDVFNQIRMNAVNAGVSIDEASKSAGRLSMSIAKSPEELVNMTSGVSNLATITQKSMDEITTGIESMWQRGATGSREFLRSGVASMLGFKEGVQYSLAETREMLTKNLTNVNGILAMGGRAMGDTWESVINQLKGWWQIFVQDIMNSGVFEWIKESLKIIIDQIKQLHSNTSQWGNVVKIISSFIIGAMKAVAISIALVVDTIRGFMIIFRALGTAAAFVLEMISRGWDYIKLGIHYVHLGILGLNRGIAVLGEAFAKVFEWITDKFADLIKTMNKILDWLPVSFLPDGWKKSIDDVSDSIKNMGSATRKTLEDTKRGTEEQIRLKEKQIDLVKEERNYEAEYWNERKNANIQALKEHSTQVPMVRQVKDAFGEVEQNIRKSKETTRDFTEAIKALKDETTGKKGDYSESIINLLLEILEIEKAGGLVKRVQKEWEKLYDTLTDEGKKRAENERMSLRTQAKDLEDFIHYSGKLYTNHYRALRSIKRRSLVDQIRDDKLDVEKRMALMVQYEEMVRKEELETLKRSTQYHKVRMEQLQDLARAEDQLQKNPFRSVDTEEQQLAIAKKYYEERKKLAELTAEEEIRVFKEEREKSLKEEISYARKKIGETTKDLMEEMGFSQSGSFEIALGSLDALREKAEKDIINHTESVEEARAQIIEDSETHIAEIRKKELDMWLNRVQSVSSMAEDAFGNLYEATGKKIKAFFYLQKAASIASTIISTYESAQKAFNAMVNIPYVGPSLAAAAAATAVAGGLARVAIISAQNMAEGGTVKGYSPHDRADNIRANLTAGEFVLPVSSVKYYGPGTMEAMRRKMIPREALRQYNLTAHKSQRHFATGGLALPKEKEEKKERQQDINIVNILTHDQIDEYMSGRQGEQAFLNIISRNNRQVKAILAQ